MTEEKTIIINVFKNHIFFKNKPNLNKKKIAVDR